MYWVGIIASEPTEGEEMSRLVVRFAARMRKRVVDSEGETTLIFDGKRLKLSSADDEA